MKAQKLFQNYKINYNQNKKKQNFCKMKLLGQKKNEINDFKIIINIIFK